MAAKDETLSDYELMVNIEKGRSMVANVDHDLDGSAKMRACKYGYMADGEPIFGNRAAGQGDIQRSAASNASVNSGQSVHYSSLSSLTRFRSLQQLDHLAQRTETHMQSQSSPFLSQPTPHFSELAPKSKPSSPPISPSACHILVKKSTKIDFRNCPKANSTVPSIPASAMVPSMPERSRGATMSVMAMDASRENDTFQGDHEHTVEISGPKPKL